MSFFSFGPRRLADKDNLWQSVILHLQNKCPSHLILSLIISSEGRIKLHFPHNLLFELRSVRRLAKQSVGNSSRKHPPLPPSFLERLCFRTRLDHCHHFNFQYSNLDSQIYLPIHPKTLLSFPALLNKIQLILK